MSTLEKIEKYTPTDDFYALDDKLFLHVLRRSDKAFDRADKLRDRVKTLEQFEKYRSFRDFFVEYSFWKKGVPILPPAFEFFS